jgi:hypothetical protein
MCVRASADEEARLGVFLASSVTPGTNLADREAFRKWRAYLDSVDEEWRPDPYLRNVDGVREKAIRLSLFAMYLHDEKGVRDRQIHDHLGSLKREFQARRVPFEEGGDPFASDVLKRALKAGARTDEERARYALEREATDVLPLPLETAWLARAKFFEGERWDCQGADRRAKWIALAVSCQGGLRISNVTRPDGPLKADHCVRAQDVLFEVMGVDGDVAVVSGGEPLRALLGDGDVRAACARVICCTFQFRSSKTIAWKMLLERKTVCESLVLDDVVLWVLKSGVMGSEYLLTRRPPPGDRVHGVVSLGRQEFSKIFPWLARQLGSGLGSFTSKSVRRGFATAAHMDRMSPAEINEGGGWSLKSKTPGRYYVPDSVRKEVPTAQLDSGLCLGAWARTEDARGRCGLTAARTLLLAKERDAARGVIKAQLGVPSSDLGVGDDLPAL